MFFLTYAVGLVAALFTFIAYLSSDGFKKTKGIHTKKKSVMNNTKEPVD